jgi:hypothetical protein
VSSAVVKSPIMATENSPTPNKKEGVRIWKPYYIPMMSSFGNSKKLPGY